MNKRIKKVSSLPESLKEQTQAQEPESVDLYRDRMRDAHHNYYKELDEAYKGFDL